jgi:hypothetical protein
MYAFTFRAQLMAAMAVPMMLAAIALYATSGKPMGALAHHFPEFGPRPNKKSSRSAEPDADLPA